MVDDIFEALGCLLSAAALLLLLFVLRLAVLVAVEGGFGAGGFLRRRIGEEVTMPLVFEELAVWLVVLVMLVVLVAVDSATPAAAGTAEAAVRRGKVAAVLLFDAEEIEVSL